MATLKPHYFSRSAGDNDDNCSRLRFWNTVYGGRGVEPTAPKPVLDFGTLVHEGLHTIWTTDKLKYPDFSAFPVDQQWLGRGLLFAYYTTVYQRYKGEGWKLLHAEKECKAHIGFSPGGRELVLLAQPDLLLQHEETGIVRYVEAKTTNTLDAAYMESWRYHPQLAAGFEAVWQTLGIEVDEFVMQLFFKGTHYEERLASVFTSGWWKGTEWEPKRPQKYAGWTRVDVPTAEIVTEDQWFDICRTKGVLAETVPETPPMAFNKVMVQNWLEQKRKREGEIADATTAALDDYWGDITGASSPQALREHFPQNFLKCRPYRGYPCPFLSLCWNPMEEKNPLQSGKYAWRVPHHATEKEALYPSSDEPDGQTSS